ncbi:hypothetical protein EBU24_02495, partial [bacterium]|nr:hypothetical protein [bacterium]
MKKLLTISLLLLVAHSLSLKGQEFDLQDFDGPQPLSHFEIRNDPFLNDESDLLDFASSNASIFSQEPQEVTYEEQEREDEQEKENVFLQIYDEFLKERAQSEETQKAKNA